MKDIIFCSLPYSNLDHIYSAPAILKGVSIQHGYSASTVDFGIELYKMCGQDKPLFYKIQNYFISPGNAGLDDSGIRIIEAFLDHVINYFKDHPSKMIGISVFSRYTHKCAMRVLTKLHDAKIGAKIIIGGRGASVPMLPTVLKDFNVSSLESVLKFGDLLTRRRLADAVVHGDGEDELVKILDGNLTLSADRLLDDETYQVVEPDYADYEFGLYLFEPGKISMPITGSKGCVRDCDFCDVRQQFGRYRYRSGQDVANEMIYVSQKYNACHFKFTDSLVNGGLKPFREFLEVIAKFNLEYPDQAVSWSGQYICRIAEQTPTDIYPLMAQSGACGLTIGAESGSNHVLSSMNKKTTVEALYDEVEQFRINGITAVILMFVGHWSERFVDFEEQCHMLIRLAPYFRSGTLSGVSLGTTFQVNESIPKEITDRIICSDVAGDLIWWMPENPDNTLKERIYRRLVLGKLCEYLHLPTKDNNTVYQYLFSTLTDYQQEIEKFSKEHMTPTESPAQLAYENFDEFLTGIVSKHETLHKFEIHVSAESFNGDPWFKACVNDTVKYTSALSAGKHIISFTHVGEMNSPMVLTVSMSDKDIYDTAVNERGEIIADKNIRLDSLIINGYNLLVDYEFVRNHATYRTEKGDTELKYGFWDNGNMRFPFNIPFNIFYNTRSDKNSKMGGALAIADNDYTGERDHLMTQLKILKW